MKALIVKKDLKYQLCKDPEYMWELLYLCIVRPALLAYYQALSPKIVFAKAPSLVPFCLTIYDQNIKIVFMKKC